MTPLTTTLITVAAIWITGLSTLFAGATLIARIIGPTTVEPGPCPGRLNYTNGDHTRCQLRASHLGLHENGDEVWGDT